MSKQEWNLLPNKGIHSCIAPSIYTAKSGSLFMFPQFPQLMGKFSKIKKLKRQCRELKYAFPDNNLQSIKEEVAPIMLLKIVDYLNDSSIVINSV